MVTLSLAAMLISRQAPSARLYAGQSGVSVQLGHQTSYVKDLVKLTPMSSIILEKGAKAIIWISNSSNRFALTGPCTVSWNGMTLKHVKGNTIAVRSRPKEGQNVIFSDSLSRVAASPIRGEKNTYLRPSGGYIKAPNTIEFQLSSRTVKAELTLTSFDKEVLRVSVSPGQKMPKLPVLSEGITYELRMISDQADGTKTVSIRHFRILTKSDISEAKEAIAEISAGKSDAEDGDRFEKLMTAYTLERLGLYGQAAKILTTLPPDPTIKQRIEDLIAFSKGEK